MLKSRQAASSDSTRQALVAAAIESLRLDGFAGASARTIARRAECNQALVFYHFGTVTDLLLAALDAVSEQRLAAYAPLLDGAHTVPDVISAAREIFTVDLVSGNVNVLLEMITGAMSDPTLSAQVAARLEPWKAAVSALAHRLLGDSAAADLVSPDEAGHLLVAMYLGLELLAGLERDQTVVLELFQRAKIGAALLGLRIDI